MDESRLFRWWHNSASGPAKFEEFVWCWPPITTAPGADRPPRGPERGVCPDPPLLTDPGQCAGQNIPSHILRHWAIRGEGAVEGIDRAAGWHQEHDMVKVAGFFHRAADIAAKIQPATFLAEIVLYSQQTFFWLAFR